MEPARAILPLRAARRLRTALLFLLVWMSLAERVLSTPIETHVAQLEVARRLQGVLAVAATVVFLLCIRRVQHNLRLLGVERLGFSPRAAVAAFLVPVANVVIPVRVVRELWHASRPEQPTAPPWWEARVPGFVLVWGTLVVVAAVADPVWRQLAGSVESLAIGGSTLLFMVVQLARLAAAVLTVGIVWTIDAQQARHFEALEGC